MNKAILLQYADMLQELQDLRSQIEKQAVEIEKTKQENMFNNVLFDRKHMMIKRNHIIGSSFQQRIRKGKLQYKHKRMLEAAETELLDLTNQIEEYIQKIEDSRTRTIFRMRYIEHLSWIQIGYRLNNTSDACRKIHDRYLLK